MGSENLGSPALSPAGEEVAFRPSSEAVGDCPRATEQREDAADAFESPAEDAERDEEGTPGTELSIEERHALLAVLRKLLQLLQTRGEASASAPCKGLAEESSASEEAEAAQEGASAAAHDDEDECHGNALEAELCLLWDSAADLSRAAFLYSHNCPALLLLLVRRVVLPRLRWRAEGDAEPDPTPEAVSLQRHASPLSSPPLLAPTGKARENLLRAAGSRAGSGGDYGASAALPFLCREACEALVSLILLSGDARTLKEAFRALTAILFNLSQLSGAALAVLLALPVENPAREKERPARASHHGASPASCGASSDAGSSAEAADAGAAGDGQRGGAPDTPRGGSMPGGQAGATEEEGDEEDDIADSLIDKCLFILRHSLSPELMGAVAAFLAQFLVIVEASPFASGSSSGAGFAASSSASPSSAPPVLSSLLFPAFTSFLRVLRARQPPLLALPASVLALEEAGEGLQADDCFLHLLLQKCAELLRLQRPLLGRRAVPLLQAAAADPPRAETSRATSRRDREASAPLEAARETLSASTRDVICRELFSCGLRDDPEEEELLEHEAAAALQNLLLLLDACVVLLYEGGLPPPEGRRAKGRASSQGAAGDFPACLFQVAGFTLLSSTEDAALIRAALLLLLRIAVDGERAEQQRLATAKAMQTEGGEGPPKEADMAEGRVVADGARGGLAAAAEPARDGVEASGEGRTKREEELEGGGRPQGRDLGAALDSRGRAHSRSSRSDAAQPSAGSEEFSLRRQIEVYLQLMLRTRKGEDVVEKLVLLREEEDVHEDADTLLGILFVAQFAPKTLLNEAKSELLEIAHAHVAAKGASGVRIRHGSHAQPEEPLEGDAEQDDDAREGYSMHEVLEASFLHFLLGACEKCS
ncbi:hypothetical protein BESB_003820 [Besnoitia besnoiti]|uniref:Uncharacterized protein n=1 Tax=Besnoitia besnoiti TaxID=94643 RepID=A0A2A9MND6_BESBE|nr:hypothetical protein BESB_003820 [Besnoitia besnoiti]PFH38041.1 hypothetical protein BESB_003820 [Besnoitia besnoiti]